jgi:hypothetical protein
VLYSLRLTCLDYVFFKKKAGDPFPERVDVIEE